MATVWSAPKQEYNIGDAIANMYPWWAGETLISDKRYEVMSLLDNILWAFKNVLAGKLSNWDDEAAFQAGLYENIDPETTKAIISAIHRPNSSMQKINTSVKSLPIYSFEKE